MILQRAHQFYHPMRHVDHSFYRSSTSTFINVCSDLSHIAELTSQFLVNDIQMNEFISAAYGDTLVIYIAFLPTCN